MKFAVKKDELYQNLQYAANFTTTKNLSTILQNVLIAATNGRVIIKSTNFQNGFSCEVPADIYEEGVTTVSAKKLTDIVKELSDNADIEFRFDGSRLHIKSEKSVFQLSTMDSDLFPQTPAITPEYSFKIDADLILSLFKRTAFCISNDMSKIEYSGAHMSIYADNIELSSADYQRIATTSAKLSESFSEEFIVNIPKKTVLELIKIFSGKGIVEVLTDKRQIMFSTDSVMLTSKLIEKYIKSINRLFLTEYKYRATMDKNALATNVRRISAITSEITHGVMLSFKGDHLTVSSLETEHGKGSADIDGVSFDGEDLDIIFNAKHLLEILTNTDAEKITLAMNSKTQPALILPDNDEAKYLMVPISIEKIT